MCVCTCVCAPACMCVLNGNTCNTSLRTAIFLAVNVCVFMLSCAVLYINVHACAHTWHIYAYEYLQECAVLYVGLTRRAHVHSPPQLGQSSRLVHTVGSFPLGGRDWGLPDEMLPDWLWNLDLRCLPPHTQTCNIMMHAHNTSHLYYSIKMKREHACAHTETLTKKTQIDPLVWVKGCISKLLNCCFYICTHVGLCAVLCV